MCKRQLVAFFSCLIAGLSSECAVPTLGLFTRNDARLEGITYGNWGSRPYEYAWASKVVSITGKRIIDLGVGLPSQYNWYHYAVTRLHPSFYAGIDIDGRIKNEEISEPTFEIKYMDMADLRYPDSSFDIALCISTFEHIPYPIFMKCITEAYRVLADNGILVATLDEWWDKDAQLTHGNGWNTLEQDLMAKGMIDRTIGSFGLPDFLALIKDYFVPITDVVVDTHKKVIYSPDYATTYYKKNNRDHAVLSSGDGVNSCVSYVVLTKVAK